METYISNAVRYLYELELPDIEPLSTEGNDGEVSLLDGVANPKAGILSNPSDETLIEMFEGSSANYTKSYKNKTHKAVSHLKALLLGLSKKTTHSKPVTPGPTRPTTPTRPTGATDPLPR